MSSRALAWWSIVFGALAVVFILTNAGVQWLQWFALGWHCAVLVMLVGFARRPSSGGDPK